MSKVIDINAYLPADIKVKTVTGKVYSMPGSIPVITVTGFEAWLNKTGKLVDDQFNKPEGKKPLRVDEVNSMFAQLTADGWKLARDIISIKQPKITMSEVKEALPSLEAITFFLMLIYKEYTPEAVGNFFEKGPVVKKSKAATTRTKNKKKKSKKAK